MASPSIMISVDRSSWRPWSDLLEELLRLVAERLSARDRIRFRAVCKNWALSLIQNENIPKLPWVVYYRSLPHPITWCFFEPRRKVPYIIEGKRWWINGSASASRCGWMLFSERIERRNNYGYNAMDPSHRHYIYHPLSKKIISLPMLELILQEQEVQDWEFESVPTLSSFNTICVATFSSSSYPTSPPHCCVFIVSITKTTGKYFFVSTYSIRDETWITYHDHPNPYFFHVDDHVNAMAYAEGTVYCYHQSGGLSSFHIATQKWKLLCNKRPSIKYMDHNDMDFIAYDGHLHLVYLKRRSSGASLCSIFKYDWSDKAWKKMKSLEGGAIFFGKPSFGIPAGKQTKMVANRVYYFPFHGSSPKFLVYGASEGEEEKSELSLSDNKIYYQSESWPKEIANTFGAIKQCNPIKHCVWMDPPPF